MSRFCVAVVSLLSFIAFTSALNQCKYGFEYSKTDNRCYYKSQTAASWSEADEMCRKLNAELVHPERAINQILANPTSVYWIGLKRNAISDRCAVFLNGNEGKAKTDYFGCSNKYPFICEAEASSQAVSSTTTRMTTTTARMSTTTSTTARTTMTTGRSTTTGPNYCPSAGHPNYGPGSGIVSSPNYPMDYPNNANCVYTIVLQSARATLTINAFNTEACCDFLYIYNGPSLSSPVIKKLSGTGYAGTTYQATSNTMTLWFTSDQTGTASGWQASYYCD